MNIESVTQSNPDPVAALLAPAKGKILDVQDFLRLLTVQLAHQDPLEPMKDTAFISQMSTFTSLELMKDLSSSFSQFSFEQQGIAAQGYLGREVTLLDADGSLVEGVVSAVSTAGGEIRITVGNVDYPLSSVQQVREPVAGEGEL